MSESPSLDRYHKRAHAHNYHAPFIYHIILKKDDRCESFGAVAGDARIAPGVKGCATINESALGRCIAKTIINFPALFPILQIYQFMVMPDHVHILLRVKEWSEYHLDFYIGQLVDNICGNYLKENIFLPGYCDKPLLLGRSLDGLFRYIRENPHRLAMRLQFPQFFRRTRKLIIGNRHYEAYGNLFLLRNPDKEAVKIRRASSLEEIEQKKSLWLSVAKKGTVLVSPFISKDEKVVRKEAEQLGAKIILITHEAFPERFKPAAHDFELCQQGHLLIISLGLPPKSILSRRDCLDMNNLAKQISNEI